MADDDKPINRRRFFRQGLGELLKPLVQAAKPLEEALRQINALDERPPARAPKPAAMALRAAPSPWLRPPGALAEQLFRDTCSRCGECVKVCPSQCIKIDPYAAQGAGAPYIDPNESPCVLCNGILCTHVCPTGALVPTALADIHIGTAVWNSQSCVRSENENCTICIDQCPVGEVAIRLSGNAVQVLAAGCTGCGVCQHDCPTSPKSIVVTPRPSAGPVPRGRR